MQRKCCLDHDIYNVKVISVRGRLTDHYNPQGRTVNLSEVVYHKRNTAVAAVAAHECDHAIQHTERYSWLTFKSKMVLTVCIVGKY